MISMYSPRVTLHNIETIEAKLGRTIPRSTIDDVIEWNARLDTAYDPQTHNITRRLTKAESAHIQDELIMSHLDYEYWVTRYAFIRTARLTLERVVFWESQSIALAHISKQEEQIADAVSRGEHVDGIMFCWLKARQLGASTVCETIISHKAFFNEAVLALIGSITPPKSKYLFNMRCISMVC